ncbi:D-alanyl-D-alanine carboxypeptidase family protein [Geomicrobium sediminis]|uniref:D-alanyl-D-alanine carboxypeptidase n=1 Tax=Geomicrobium sediminis TaxID=1347788 RepID=A0ABS2PDT0_9BACL|nr:D-alanyl-D-alanine carboxypeptidase family protein [Geomicrobium sediminis]MBM7633579.1 D-alanyl-D-alanine carboxypeptidase [Geomicrobium sediminis]
MKRRAIGCLVLALLFIIHPWTGQAETPASEAPFSVSGEAAVLIEVDSGRVMYEKNADTSLRIASITKIMTALIAIEQGELDDKVTISSNAEGTEGSSLYLRAGEKVTLEDLIYGLMLRSGNDSAVAIAEHVGGSIDGFVYLMNEKVHELGLEKTVFANPHGLDDHEEHYSSAKDMAVIMQEAMKYEKFRDISGTKIHKAPNENESWDRVWKNKNRLLTERYEYSTGGKTGFTKRAKRTLVSSAEKDGMELIAVTLNAPSDWDDHVRMFEYGFSDYEMTTLINEGELTRSEVQEDLSGLYVKESVRYPLKEDEEKRVVPKVVLTEEDDERAGSLQFMLDNQTLTSLPVFKMEEEVDEKPSFWSRIKQQFEQWMR